MIVCLCGGVSDRQIREASARHHGDLASTLAATGACQDCRSCRKEIKKHCHKPCDGERHRPNP